MKKLLKKVGSALCSVALAFSLVPVAAAPALAEEVDPVGAAAEEIDDTGAYNPGEVLVAYTSEQPGVFGMLGRSITMFSHGAQETETIETPIDDVESIVKMEVPEERIDDFIDAMQNDPGVAWAQRNFRYTLLDEVNVYTPEEFEALAVEVDDPATGRQYYLDSWEENHGANVRAAWEEATAEDSVTIAILDTGILPTHEDLAPNIDIAHMIDVFSNTAAGIITDYIGHGTHVAGIAAGAANNGVGIAGASHNAKILPIKVFNNSTGNYASTDSVYLLRAYTYLADLMDRDEVTDLHVINMSLGGYGSAGSDDRALQESIAAMNDRGVMTVCAGGNGDENGNAYTIPSYPSDFEECLAVTALGRNGNNTQWSDYNAYKDISAPGEDIYSTYYASNSSYVSMDGTSMASPLVAGIAALMWAANPDLTVERAMQIITEEAYIPLDSNGTNYHTSTETGSPGAIDALAAVQAAKKDVDPNAKYLSRAVVTLDEESFIYDGTEKKPAVTVTFDGKELVEDVDYTLTYADNVQAGTARITVTGTGDFSGRKTVTFKILNDIGNGGHVRSISAKNYTGKPIEPTVTVVWNNKTLTGNVDYTVGYEDNILPGTARVIITGIGSFGGSFEGTFTIKGDAGTGDNAGDTTGGTIGSGGSETGAPGGTTGGNTGNAGGGEIIGDDNTPLAPTPDVTPGSIIVYVSEQGSNTKYLAGVASGGAIDAMARTGQISSQYVKSTDNGKVWQVWTATKYVTLQSVLSSVGLGSLWNKDASLTYGTRNRVQTYTYQRMVDDSWFFPAASSMGPSTTGAQKVEPIIALSAGKTEVTSTAGATVADNVAKASSDSMPMMLFGSSWDEYLAQECYGMQYWTGLDTITLNVPAGQVPDGLEEVKGDGIGEGEEEGDADGDGLAMPDYSDVELPFSDIAPDHWVLTTPEDNPSIYIKTMVGMGLMSGYADTGDFGADDNLSRGQLATILFRAANPDSVATSDPDAYALTTKFSDVPINRYYTAAVNWCFENGIVSGYTDTNTFKPENPISRQELAKMVAGYAAYMAGIDVEHSPATSLDGMADKSVSETWAVPYLSWCAENGIMTGSPAADGTTMLHPAGKATRAEMCKMMTLTLGEVFEALHVSDDAEA